MFAFSVAARARHSDAFAALPKRSLIHASWFIAWKTPELSPCMTAIGSERITERLEPESGSFVKSHVSIVYGRMQSPCALSQRLGLLVM